VIDQRGRLLLAVLGFTAALAIGCSRGPDAQTRRHCDTAKRWVNLDDRGVARCLQDDVFREQLGRQVDELFAAQLATTHNRDRNLLHLRGEKTSSFTRLARPAALPGQTLGMNEQEKHIGERYVVRARVAWSESFEREMPPHIFLNPLIESEEQSTLVGTDALNQYQRQFLSTHCWPGGPPPTLCEGDVYLEIRKDARGFFVEAQVLAADFGDADAKALFAYFNRPRPESRSRRSSAR